MHFLTDLVVHINMVGFFNRKHCLTVQSYILCHKNRYNAFKRATIVSSLCFMEVNSVYFYSTFNTYEKSTLRTSQTFVINMFMTNTVVINIHN